MIFIATCCSILAANHCTVIIGNKPTIRIVTFFILLNTRTSAVKLKTRWDSQGIIQKTMTSSKEIQFKQKFAINLYTICISLGITSSLCCGCSGKHSLVLVWPAFGTDCFTGPEICLHERAQGWLGFSCRNGFVGEI